MKFKSIVAIAAAVLVIGGGAYGYTRYQHAQHIAELQKEMDFYSQDIERNRQRGAAIDRVESKLWAASGKSEFPTVVASVVDELLAEGVILNYSEDYLKVSKDLADQRQRFAKQATVEYDLVDNLAKDLAAAKAD